MTQDLDKSVIPHGPYCYTATGEWEQVLIDGIAVPAMKTKICPYWSKRADKPDQESGYCAFLKDGDWKGDGFGLLWDQVKECGVNDDDD